MKQVAAKKEWAVTCAAAIPDLGLASLIRRPYGHSAAAALILSPGTKEIFKGLVSLCYGDFKLFAFRKVRQGV
jgi:hypothetical protein